MPGTKKERFINSFGIKNYDAEILVSERETADFFEKVVKNRDPKLVLTWITGELFSYLNKKNLTLSNAGISPKKICEILDLIIDGTISNRMAKELFEEFLNSDKKIIEIIKQKGLTQISDEGEIDSLITNVFEENPKMLTEYKSGKEKLFGFFVGQAMKLSNGKANPQIVNSILKKRLSK